MCETSHTLTEGHRYRKVSLALEMSFAGMAARPPSFLPLPRVGAQVRDCDSASSWSAGSPFRFENLFWMSSLACSWRCQRNGVLNLKAAADVIALIRRYFDEILPFVSRVPFGPEVRKTKQSVNWKVPRCRLGMRTTRTQEFHQEMRRLTHASSFVHLRIQWL